jgi:hypothetical protein
VITFKTHAKSGELVAARIVNPEQELILISEGGIILRTPVAHISLQGRSTQGVRLMDVGEDDRVAAVAVIDMSKEYDTLPLPIGANGEGDDGIERKPAKYAKAKPSGNGTGKPKPSGNGKRGK